MNITSCPKCGARWIDGQLFWATGKQGKAEDLAGLVCDPYGDDQCINEMRGKDHKGQTWEERMRFLDRVEEFELTKKKP